jgi:pilus assembly protein CpaB
MRTVALIVAIVLAIAAAIGIRTYLKGEARKIEQQNRLVPVAVAKTTIEAGQKLTRENVEFQDVPANTLSPDIIPKQEIDRYYDREVTQDIGRGIPIRASHFINRDTRVASDRLIEGRRAIAVAVDATSGVAGLIRPGDHVDIYSTTRGTQTRTWLVLEDVTVLAVDDRMTDVPAGLGDYRQYRRGYSSLTLSVTPAEAEVMTYLKDAASITFALCPRVEVGGTGKAMVVDAANAEQLAQDANKKRQEQRQRIEGVKETGNKKTP